MTDSNNIIQLASSGDASALRATLRDKAIRSLYFFNKVVMGFKEMVDHFHLPFCDDIQNTWREQRRGYLMPRFHFKSTVGKGYCPWRLITLTEEEKNRYGAERDLAFKQGLQDEWEQLEQVLHLHDPNTRVALIGESDTIAEKNLRDIKGKIEKSQLLRWLFPELIPQTGMKWAEDCIELPRSKSFDEFSIHTFGISSRKTGLHFDILLYDDFIGEDASRSEAEMNKAWDSFQKAPGLSNDPFTVEELIFGTRWKHGTADVYGRIMKHMPTEDKYTDEDGNTRTTGFRWYIQSCWDEEGNPIFPERVNRQILEGHRKRMGQYNFACFVAGTQILMGDWTEKPVEEIKPGDLIIGMDKNSPRRCLDAGIVRHIGERQAEVFEVEFSDGNKVTCTEDHPFLNGSKGQDLQRRPYLTPKIGNKVVRVYSRRKPPSEVQKGMLQWLVGMIDADGCISPKSPGMSISQSKEVHPEVCAKIEGVLQELNIPYTHTYSGGKGFAGNQIEAYLITGGRSTLIWILTYGNFAKKLSAAQWLWRHSSGNVGETGEGVDSRPYIVNITPKGERTVYNFETDLHTYVANSFTVHNCQFENNPTAVEGADFRPEWIKTYTISPDKKTILPDDGTPPIALSKLLRMAFYDPSSGGKSATAENAIAGAGMSADRRMFVLKMWSKNTSFGVALEEYHRINDSYMFYICFYEDVGAQKALEDILRERRAQTECRYCKEHGKPGMRHKNLLLVPIKPPGGKGKATKEERIRTFSQPVMEEGRFYVHRGMLKLKKQILDFPHGDLVDEFDAIAYLCWKLRPPVSDEAYEEEQDRQEKAQAPHVSRTNTERNYGGYA